jgi:class 3 adenylate cyclase
MLRDRTPDAAGLSGERKQVTVVFADVKGSMDLAEQVDPEKWRAGYTAHEGHPCLPHSTPQRPKNSL